MKKLALSAIALILVGSVCQAQTAGKRNIFLGLNGSAGLPIVGINWPVEYSDIIYTYGFGGMPEFGLDFAYPVSQNFAIGFYVGGGPCFGRFHSDYKDAVNVQEMFIGGEFKFGVLMLAGDVNRRPFIIGLVPMSGLTATTSKNIANDGLPLEIRFGKVFTDHFYMTANCSMALFSGHAQNDISIITPSLTFGYHFGSKFKTK